MAKKNKEAWGENGFEDWGGYMAAKKAKLEEQFQAEASKQFKEASNLFQGIAIFVNGYTDPTADELRRLMMAHGGLYHHYLRPKATTHIIATNLPFSKIAMYRKSQSPVPICKPQWILDSIKAGRVLNFQNYLLYSNCTSAQPQLQYQVKPRENERSSCLEADRKVQTDDPVGLSKDSPVINTKAEITASEPVLDQNKPTDSKNALSTKNSGFLSEFYSHSRLHHISTMGATFKEYVNELRDKSTGKFPGLGRLKELNNPDPLTSLSGCDSSFSNKVVDQQENNKEMNLAPVIMHIDMDCFFVSVGLRDKLELKGLPVAVTHAKGNKQYARGNEIVDSSIENEEEHGSLSEIASCSYEARKAGVKNGMFLGEALKLCPNLKTIPYDFEGYKEVSYALYDTIASYTLDIEAVSCDEMYVDCSKILEESNLSPMEFASIVRKEIKQKTGCPVSTGFGSNKLLARLATRKAKPDGQFHIEKGHVESYVGTFNVRDLPGVGGTTAYKLNGINVHTCAELQKISLAVLQKEFGKKTGEALHNMCRGIDNTKLNVEHIRKSVSAEVNYGIRFDNNDDAIDFLKKLSEEVCSRLKKIHGKGRCITLKLMVRAKEAPTEAAKFMGHGLCDYMTKSKNLIAPVNDVDIITKEVVALWTQLQQVPEDARGIGIQISRLEISKNKSRDTTLTSFISKDKGSIAILRSTELNAEVAEKSSKAKGLRRFFPSKSAESEHAEYNEVREPTTSAVGFSANTNSNSGNTDNTNFQVPSNIHQSILDELPEDIRNEILSMQRKKDPIDSSGSRVKNNPSTVKINDKVEKNIQTRQENFFKHVKPNVARSAKVEMPAIEEVDMSVLIELPEDIRNEILNEYRMKKQGNKVDNAGTSAASSCPTSKHIATATASTLLNQEEEENISFSQVDPEFLAALSDDMKRDVQIYCSSKKAEKTKRDEERAHNSRSAIPPVPKQNKKMDHPSKVSNNNSNNRNAKTVGGKNNRKKDVRGALKNLEKKKQVEVDSGRKSNSDDAKCLIPSSKEVEVYDGITEDQVDIILSHNRTISENSERSSGNERLLVNLVNRLFDLPLTQVKMQIQTWIANSNIVNEIDFLSLATFLSMLPQKKRIEDLHVLLKSMHRCMTKSGNCIWHRAYRKTVKYVQHYMQIEYNSNLMVPPIRCNLPRCNSDIM